MNAAPLFSRLAMAVMVVGLATACSSTASRESVGEYIDNSVITTKVKAALIEAPDVNALQVKVDTLKDRVLLSGFVKSETERVKAEEIAAGVEGVRAVENRIVMNGYVNSEMERLKAEEIAAGIEGTSTVENRIVLN